MSGPVISPDGKWIWTGDKWIDIKDENDSVISKSDTEKDKIKVNFKPQYPIFKRKIGYIVLGLYVYSFSIWAVYTSPFTIENSITSCAIALVGLLLTNVKYCKNSTHAIIYYLHQGPQKYDELKNKLNINRFQFDSILDQLREELVISFIYTTKKADRLILLGDD